MVQIANPIYDVVFKYLMNDEKVAKLLLSAIIGKEVVDLQFRPTEHQLSIGQALTVLRMDFSARIKDADGREELIILELQKAKMAGDIMRFRRYLGEQYANKDNAVREREYAYRKALPILSIYFLGHPLAHIQAPVVRVNRTYTDAANGEPILQKEEFIESLTHDSIIIQVPFLKGKRRTELEQLLALFDQSASADDPHFLHIQEQELPERYLPLLRRLQKAVADPTLRQSMDTEDDIVEELKDYQRQIAEKDREIQRQEQAAVQLENALREQRAQLERAVRQAHQAGIEPDSLCGIFGLTPSELAIILST